MSEYDADFVLWSREQADLLRRMAAGERVNDQVYWENLAEEIESLEKQPSPGWGGSRPSLNNALRFVAC